MIDEKLEQALKLFGELEAERTALGTLNAETKRNTDNVDLFEAMIREIYPDVTTIAAGHHIMYLRAGYPLPFEFPSADMLIFDHAIAKVIWKDQWQAVLTRLALTPTETRDALVRELYAAKSK